MRSPDPRSDQYGPPGSPPPTPTEGRMLEVPTPGRGFTTAGLTFAAAALVFPPLALVAIGFAFAGKRRGDPWGQNAIILCIAAFAGGIAVASAAATLDPDALFVIEGLW